MQTVLENYLKRLAEEARLQLEADKTWWSKRKAEHESQSKAARERKARLLTNPILGDLRQHVTDEESAAKVRKALDDVQRPEILEAIQVANPGFGLDHQAKLARLRLIDFEKTKA